MDIESAFNILTGNTDNVDIGKIRGTTKKEVKKLCGDDWDEYAWKRMINLSNKHKHSINNELPFYDKKEKLWFWF